MDLDMKKLDMMKRYADSFEVCVGWFLSCVHAWVGAGRNEPPPSPLCWCSDTPHH